MCLNTCQRVIQRKEVSKTVDPEKLKEHHANPVSRFVPVINLLLSRFLLVICKRMVHCFELPSPDLYKLAFSHHQTAYLSIDYPILSRKMSHWI